MAQQQVQDLGPLGEALLGETLGVSAWLTVTQDMICAFGAATLDADPMHDDPAWAADNSPYGGTIAYGFQTIGLLTHLMRTALAAPETMAASPKGYPLNYGFDRLRLVSPVPVGARIRGRFTLLDRAPDEKGRIIQRVGIVVDIENQDRPALVGDWLFVWVPTAS